MRVLEHYFIEQDDNYAEPSGDDLEEALTEVAYASQVLHRAEGRREIDAETLCDLFVCLANAEDRLTRLTSAEGDER